MVQSFQEFCGNSALWDLELLTNSSYPRFTECFQNTLLVWVPCGFLWLLMPVYMYTVFRSVDPPLPLTCLNVSKSLLSMALFFLSGVDTLYAGSCRRDDESRFSTAYLLAGGIQAATFLQTSVSVQVGRMKGVVTSGTLFVFWFLTTIAGIVPFYTLILQKVYEDDMFRFTMFYLQYVLVLIQLVLSGFSETKQQRGYQPLQKFQSPELTASFPSKLTFQWMTSLVVGVFRSGITEDELWELHPRDQSGTILPRFHRVWQDTLQKHRQSGPGKEQGSKQFGEHGLHYKTHCEKASLIPVFSKGKQYNTFTDDDDEAKKRGNYPEKNGPSLLKVIVRVFGKHVFIGWMCKLVNDFLQFVSPMILNLLIGYVQSKSKEDGKEQVWTGYVYAASLSVVAATQSVFFHQTFHMCMTAGMRIRSALISAVYNKALTMNNETRKTKTQGEIINLMAVDCQRIQDITTYLWVIWSVPVQVTLAMLLLWNTLGVSVISGFVVLVLMVPLNALITHRMRECQMHQMRLKDQRLKLMNEMLNGIKVLKLYAWEPSFEKKVQDVRDKEIAVIRKGAYLNAVNTFFWTSAPFVVTMVTFATYILIDDNNQLDAQKAFVSFTLFNILRQPINLLPMIMSNIVQANVALGRLSRFLQAGDLEPENVERNNTLGCALSIENGTFSWDREVNPTLNSINLEVPVGSLVAVVGQVGAGKSSLISALLGDMEKVEGTVIVNGRVAYVAQQAWIQNDTLKGNILFGKNMQEGMYEKVIDACALRPDLDLLPGGDMTEIGEKGINLSGGQKQRVSLARAVYHNADIYLLDDPLSAVDSHVGKHIFNKVIGARGLLRQKTRILVTHGVHWLPIVDQIVVVVDGKISELGSYEELMSHDGAFAQFLKTYLTQHGDDDDDDPEVQQVKSKMLERVDSLTSGSEGTGISGDDTVVSRLKTKKPRRRDGSVRTIDGSVENVTRDKPQAGKDVDKLIETELSETSQVSWKVYMKYFHAIGLLSSVFIIGFYTIYSGIGIGNSIWLARWTDDQYLMNVANVNTTEYKNKNYTYLGGYASIGVGQAILFFVWIFFTSIKVTMAAGKLHNSMLANVLKLPMAFFDTNPIGRILNRFSRDVDTIDNNLPDAFRSILKNGLNALSAIVVIAYSTPLFIIAVVPMSFFYYLLQRFYIPTTRQLKRIESTTRSPIYSHFGETIAGASTIRAFNAQERFIQESRDKVDKNLSFYFAGIASNRWLGIRLEILGNMMVLAAAMFAVSTPDNTGGLVGLSISYALQVTNSLNFLVRNMSDMETNVVSVERVKEYTDKPTEAEWRLPSHKPSTGWPDSGNIRINNYSTRYREGLDLVLKGISCDIKGGERIGIVGRTGAGKSSLTVALFRIIEAAGGNIVIDGERISDMGLHDLREKLTILPQDPVLFSGSLRMNLDPFDVYTDVQIWRALEHAHMKAFVSGQPEGLGHDCGEGGQNLSVGQRQLVCLARTLLRKTKILIFDEATAAVDMETDDLIQRTIREEFKGCTILTIAHRLNTVLDYDRIVVMDRGLIVEIGSPQSLLENSSTVFHSMAKDANLI